MVSGLAELCERSGVGPDEIAGVFHGTTMATNAVLEHRGAGAGLITTKGFRDIIHIGRHQRPQHYSMMQEIPWQERPLVMRRFRMRCHERLVPPNGEVLVAAGRGGGAGGSARAEDGGRRGDRRVLPVLVPESRA